MGISVARFGGSQMAGDTYCVFHAQWNCMVSHYWTVPNRPVIDVEHLGRQRQWSIETFGPGLRTKGITDHIRKELLEIEAEPTSLEWIDVVILALDGAWRAGYSPEAIIAAIKAKQAKNETREWPDWRTRSEDEAIEHVRT
jgi:hypothetical protein